MSGTECAEIPVANDIRACMASGQWFDACDASLDKDRAHARAVMLRFNTDAMLDDADRMTLLRTLFGSVGEGSAIMPGIQVDYGYNIHIGRNCFFNFNSTFLDGAPIVFGNDVWVGPGCTFATPLHPLLGRERAIHTDAEGVRHLCERNLSIAVGNDVWIASSVTINPGVTIGDGVVIGSGSVVTKDVPSHTIAFGNPCRVARELTQSDSIADALVQAGIV